MDNQKTPQRCPDNEQKVENPLDMQPKLTFSYEEEKKTMQPNKMKVN